MLGTALNRMRNLAQRLDKGVLLSTRRMSRDLALFAAACAVLPSGAASAQGILTVTPARTSATYVGLGGTGTAAPTAVAYDSAGNTYFATANHVVREVIKTTGTIVTVAGTSGSAGFGGDGGAATSAFLDTPTGIALDSANNLYIADSHNHRIRKVTGGTITTIAGTGTAGFSGDGAAATAATLSLPSGVAVDATGNVYIADTNNQRIRKITGTAIATVAGTGVQALAGDGAAATAASLDSPTGVAVDAAGNLYIADRHNQRVRQVNAVGVISTLAGSGTPTLAGGFSGDGSNAATATLAHPTGLFVDASGNVFVADTNNQRIRQISGTTIGTVAGSGNQGFGGDGGVATAAILNAPTSATADASGNLAVADTLDQRVRVEALPTLTFASNVGTSSAGQAVTLANTGSAPIVVSAINVAGSFAIASGGTCPNAPVTLAPGASCTENVVYTPTASGASTGRVAFGGAGVVQQAVLLAGNSGVGTSSVTVSSSANPVIANQPVTFTATITPATATGTVTFFANGVQIGTAQPVSGGTASLTTAFNTATSYSITAVYSGDANYSGATSPALSQIIGPATFTITDPNLPSFSLSITQGNSATTSITIAPAGNFVGTVTLSCANLPANLTCYFFNPTLTFTGTGGAQSSALRIDSYTLNASEKARQISSSATPIGPRLALSFALPGVLLLCGVGARSRKLQGHRKLFLLAVLVVSFAGTASISGCGSGDSFLSGKTLASAGTYKINVVATSGSTVQTLPLNVTIQ